MNTILLLFMMFAPALEAQTTDYRTLWQRGDYAEAIGALETRFERLSYRPRSMRRDYAELLFGVGRVDDAIDVLEGLAMSAIDPGVMVRLAQWYHYRGVWRILMALSGLLNNSFKVCPIIGVGVTICWPRGNSECLKAKIRVPF